MGNVYSVQSDDRTLIDLVAGVCLQDNSFFAVTLAACEDGGDTGGGSVPTRVVSHSCEVITAAAAEGQGPFLRMAVARTTEQKLVAVQPWPSAAGTGMSRPPPPPPLPPPLVRPWVVDRHLLYDAFCRDEPVRTAHGAHDTWSRTFASASLLP